VLVLTYPLRLLIVVVCCDTVELILSALYVRVDILLVLVVILPLRVL